MSSFLWADLFLTMGAFKWSKLGELMGKAVRLRPPVYAGFIARGNTGVPPREVRPDMGGKESICERLAVDQENQRNGVVDR